MSRPGRLDGEKLANVRGLRLERFEEYCKQEIVFCSGYVEASLASKVILGQKFCGDVWEFS